VGGAGNGAASFCAGLWYVVVYAYHFQWRKFMIIRLVREEDLLVCGDIYAKAFSQAPYFGVWTTETAANMLAGLLSRDPESCWCVENDSGILGFAFCTTYGSFRGTIQEFAIAPGSQKRGIGTLMMEHILTQFRSRGLQNVDLVANLDASAFKFYKKFGFQHPDRYVVMARPL